ncbi:hypothetical protein PFISCL1PPCAC_28455, partial [Pristionchus fissidentatus]
VCEVCTRQNLDLLECNECCDLSSDLEYSISFDKEKCILKRLQYDGKFQTDKGLIKGPLSCNKTHAMWTYKTGNKVIEVGKFAAYKSSPKVQSSGIGGWQIALIVGCLIVVLILLIALFYKVFIVKRLPEEEQSTRKSPEEKKQKRKSSTHLENDEDHEHGEEGGSV